MNHYFGPPRLAVTGRLLLPTGEHWLVEVDRSGEPDRTGPTFRWELEGATAHSATCVRPFGDDRARREIELEVFGPLVDDSWLPVLS